jgi:hypothetical protein
MPDFGFFRRKKTILYKNHIFVVFDLKKPRLIADTAVYRPKSLPLSHDKENRQTYPFLGHHLVVDNHFMDEHGL